MNAAARAVKQLRKRHAAGVRRLNGIFSWTPDGARYLREQRVASTTRVGRAAKRRRNRAAARARARNRRG